MLQISGEEFHLEKSQLHVKMRVCYSISALNSGQILNFTPIIRNGNNQQTLTTVVINGRERGNYEDRKAKLQLRQRENMPEIRYDGNLKKYYFDYNTIIPYSQWMKDAALYIQSEECGWNGSTRLYEDKLMDLIAIEGMSEEKKDNSVVTTPLAASMDWVPFIPPTAVKPVTEQQVTGQIMLADNRQIGQMGNRAFCNSIYDCLKQELTRKGGTVSELLLHGFGAPIGNHQRNEQRCFQRSQELKEYLLHRNFADALSVTWTAEDWQSIIRLTQADCIIPLRSAAIEVMQSVNVANGREDQLKALSGGQTYAMLKKHIFPRVQRIEYTATIQFTDEERKAETASLISLYNTASSFARGSQEYNDIIFMAARLYPNNPVAVINAAGLALIIGDVSKAESYLEKWITTPLAYQNLGVLYLLKGDKARADLYLKKASVMGVTEANNVLNKI
jgi:hypothetical protein